MMADAYHAYLQSDAWRALFNQALDRAGHRCQLCNRSNGLQAHHRTYERVGHELLDDLTVLCDDCHIMFHQHTNTLAYPFDGPVEVTF
jgi:hypothetical protein